VLSVGQIPTDTGSALGQWALEKPTPSIFIIQPGLATSLSGGKTATRGCGRIDFKKSIASWILYQHADLTMPPSHWPSITVPRIMMISRRQALARRKPWLAGSFQPCPLTITFHGGKRDLDKATPLHPGSTAWKIPPILYEPFIATVKDLKEYGTYISKRIKSGDYDHVPGEPTFDALEDGRLDITQNYAW
jgi:hypothetical protein